MNGLKTPDTLLIFSVRDWEDYALVDSGNGSKLEQFGKYCIVRPESQALWKPHLSSEEWDRRAYAVFWSKGEGEGGWKISQQMLSNLKHLTL